MQCSFIISFSNPLIFPMMCLPNTVRVDEDRPDILKAMIVAPEGTPYENGCFEFDILLPLDYPNVPPKVHLATTNFSAVRFNPNLYNVSGWCFDVFVIFLGIYSMHISDLVSCNHSIRTLHVGWQR